MKRIVVMGSGNGSNFQAIAEYIRDKGLPIEISAMITDNPKAFIIERAKNLGIQAKVLDYKSIGDKALYNRMLLDLLLELTPDLVVLAGYMRILPPEIVKAFRGKIINIHPALLPSFPGLHAIEQAWSHGVKVTGVTVHYVDEGVDTGPIIDQVPVRIEPGDTLESLEAKIHEAEHELYPKVIQRILLGD
ncbi:MAG: phosphoribosylglycinamide formyltransferase [candidate division WOR-3 bacterium]